MVHQDREIAVQIASSRDLEVTRRVLLMLGVLAAQVLSFWAEGVALGSGGAYR